MAIQGNNMYALLDGDVENLISGFAATTATVEEPSEMRKSNRSPSQNLSKLQPPSDEGSETGRNKRQNGNDFKGYNGQQNSLRPDEQHEAQRNGFRKSQEVTNAGYRPDRRPGCTSKQHEGQQKRENRPVNNWKQDEGQRKRPEPTNGGQRPKEAEITEGCRPDDGSKQDEGCRDGLKKEEVGDGGEEWQVIRRRNHRRFGSLGNEEGGEIERKGERRRELQGNGERRRREFKGNVGRGERNGEARRGSINGGIAEKLSEAKVEGMASLEEQSAKGDVVGEVSSKEPESKNFKEFEFRRRQRDQRMTLKDYEKRLEEKRKALESTKKQEQRVVTLDKDFESMHVVEKKKEEEEETIFIKLNSEIDRPKKKGTAGKNGNNAPKPLVTNFKIAGTNYENRVRRYSVREGSRDINEGLPRRKGESEENGIDNRSSKIDENGNEGQKGGNGDLKRKEEKPPLMEEHFPTLYIGSMKARPPISSA